jgi:hypothetical protein
MQVADIRSFASRRRGTTGFVAGVVIAVAVAGGGVAVAAIPSSSTGQITACVAKVGGTVRVIDYQAGKRCKKVEKTVAWSKGWSYRGAYVATTAYPVNSVVVDSGSSYLARKSSTGKAPATNPTYWGLLAAAATAGATGPAGATGATGPAGPVAVKYVEGASVSGPAGAQTRADAQCPAGWSVIGGGARSDSGDVAVNVNSSMPTDGNDANGLFDDAWRVDMNNADTAPWTFRAWAICVVATSTSGG